MKKIKVGLELIKRILIIILMMSGVYILIDFYIPIKRLFLGDKMPFGEIFGYINYIHHLPYILLVGLLLGFLWYKNDMQKEVK